MVSMFHLQHAGGGGGSVLLLHVHLQHHVLDPWANQHSVSSILRVSLANLRPVLSSPCALWAKVKPSCILSLTSVFRIRAMAVVDRDTEGQF